MSEELKESIPPLLKDYDNMCFCEDPACLNYQVTLELRDQLLELFKQYLQEREAKLLGSVNDLLAQLVKIADRMKSEDRDNLELVRQRLAELESQRKEIK